MRWAFFPYGPMLLTPLACSRSGGLTLAHALSQYLTTDLGTDAQWTIIRQPEVATLRSVPFSQDTGFP